MSAIAATTSRLVGDAAVPTEIDPSTYNRFLEALQPGVMGPRLAAVTAAGPAACHVQDAKYEPGVRAIVLYAVAGRLVRGDVVTTMHMERAEARLVPPGIRCHSFPADPELPALSRVLDPGELSAALARTGLRGGVSHRTGSRCRPTLLRYRPGKRATALVSPGIGGQYIVKAYHDQAKAAAVVRTCVALEESVSQPMTLSLAPTLAHLSDLATVVQRRVSGVALGQLLGGRRGPLMGAGDALERAGRALAELHELTVSPARERPVEAELRRFGKRAGRIAGVAPVQGAVLSGLAERLSATRTCLPPDRTGLVHGDCKPSQFLLGDEQVLLLDLDHVGLTEQASDVGTFLASMRQLAVRNAHSGSPAAQSSQLAALRRLFFDSYRGFRDVPEVTVRWHEAVALERKALRAFARAPRSPMVPALAAEAHRCLDEVEDQAGTRSIRRGERS